MQLRFATGLTSTEYVTQEAWQEASLDCCPRHPHGGCSFARHGTYKRVNPPGTRIPRWYCPESHCTFSLLADCFAARLSGTLNEVEAVVRVAEQAPSREAAADGLRLDIELPGALRWMRRRLQAVYVALHLLKHRETLLPRLGAVLTEAARDVRSCSHCGNLDAADPCWICADPERSGSQICVVEQIDDLWALERSGVFKGRYHVLGGTLSALDGRGPDELGVDRLVARVSGYAKRGR